MPNVDIEAEKPAQWPFGLSGAAQLMRTTAWSDTSLGAPETWGATLRATVNNLLACEFPMVVLWGKDLTQIYNDGYKTIMGAKHPAGMGQPTKACWPEVWQFNAPIYASILRGESLTLEDQLFPIDRHGYLEQAYFTLCYSPVFDEVGDVEGILITVFETTGRVQAALLRAESETALSKSEERLRLALSGANGVGIWDWDTVTDRFYADAKFAVAYGVDPELAATGTPLANFTKNIHPEDIDRIQRSIALTLQSGQDYAEEYRLLQKDGSVRWVMAKGHLISSPNGTPLRFPGVTTDITDQKRAEQALRLSEKLAAVGRLASSIAHEINNPLEAVTNLLYLARTGDEELPAETKNYLDTAERELRRVSLIANQTLRFHKQSTSPKSISCSDLVTDILSLYQGRLVNSGITVETGKCTNLSVKCFEGEVRQVLTNIIGNAIDAMHPAGGRLIVRSRNATRWATGAKGLTLTIADTGVGMNEQITANMFDAFFTTKGITGTGLGLWVSREIMERHGGEIRVRSRQGAGAGSVFTLFLPFDAVVRSAASRE
jgi:signal transduction histidine kinase